MSLIIINQLIPILISTKNSIWTWCEITKV